MRFYLLTILCVLAIGCNSDPNCRRETALLRSEILDLEDKYYMLKSERDALLQGQGFSQGYAEGPIHLEGQLPYEGPIYSEGQPLHEGPFTTDGQDGQLLIGEGPYDPFYDHSISYGNSQSHYVDTGQPYYAQTDGLTGIAAYSDADVVYENAMAYEGEVLPYGEPTLAHSSEPTLAQSEIRLEPDDSILPLDADETGAMETDSYAEDFTLPPGLIEGLSDTDSSTSNDELNLLLEPPSDIEVGFNQKTAVQEITEVVINRLATQGHDIDGVPGDEGLDLLIQPRSADGQVQLVGGELTVSVIDPTRSVDKQRIGLWKFVKSETELFFANDELGSYGILLHLPWDQETPVNKKLTVHVRFIPAGGGTFETATELLIDPPQADYSPEDPLVTGWTRSDNRWNTELGSSTKPALNPSAPGRSGASQWIRRQTAAPVRMKEYAQPIQRATIPAVPAKATIKKPAWRPTR